jgi:aflatoxin B1 aldehyde reductase
VNKLLSTQLTSINMPLVAQRPKDRVVLGLMTFGPDAKAGGRITDPAEYGKILDYFQSKGYNEVDTARAYIGGKQEAFTRDAGWKDRGLTLATKHYPFEPGQHSPEKLRAACEKSLGELGTDTVDIYYLHAADRSVPFEETLREVNKMHKEGKFVQLGLSNFTAFEVAEVVMTCKANKWVRPTIYQGRRAQLRRQSQPNTCEPLR